MLIWVTNLSTGPDLYIEFSTEYVLVQTLGLVEIFRSPRVCTSTMYKSGLVDMLVTHANIEGFGLTPLSWDRRGYMPPLLKTKTIIFYQILISYCKFIKTKALKWGMLCLCTLIFSKIFIKCFKNLILLSGPNRFSVRPSYLFSLVHTAFRKCTFHSSSQFNCYPIMLQICKGQ